MHGSHIAHGDLSLRILEIDAHLQIGVVRVAVAIDSRLRDARKIGFLNAVTSLSTKPRPRRPDGSSRPRIVK